MSAQAALQIASSIQSKVGSSLLGVNSMLPPAEASAAILQAGGGSLGVFLLKDLHIMQTKTFECVEKVAHILQSQLDIAEEAERRARDQAAELAKEKKPEMFGPPAPTGVGGTGDINANLDDIEDAVNKGTIADLITGGLTAALLAPGALKALGKGLAKRLGTAAVLGAIAAFIADPVIEYIDDSFNLDYYLESNWIDPVLETYKKEKNELINSKNLYISRQISFFDYFIKRLNVYDIAQPSDHMRHYENIIRDKYLNILRSEFRLILR